MNYRHRKCRCCHEWFLPQAHNAYHQHYCTQSACRHASHRSSQQRWCRKNRDHYRGELNVERVRQWRDEHPDYAQGNKSVQRLLLTLKTWPEEQRRRQVRLRMEDPKSGWLQDLFCTQALEIKNLTMNLECTLQDFIRICATVCYS